ncbi:hydroxyacid dehydrogenase [Streptomyces sp. NPDC090106]|uniref:hydroxyacid dehydrogenase n=1 Tax=Streptomyces sp. NPDC090106 TaxID=3365946 RepID=UPI00382E5AAD
MFGDEAWNALGLVVDVVAECADVSRLLEHPRAAQIEVLLTSWGSPRLDAEVLHRLPALRLVAHVAGSVRRVVTDAVWERGITVLSAADANNEPVAEYVCAQTVLALKDVHRRTRRITAERTVPGITGIPGIGGGAVGLVSFGSIARKVARRLRRLGVEVLAWDPYQPAETFAADGAVQVAGLPELVSRSRVLSIHTPLIAGRTDGLLGGDLLRLLPPGATVLNTARGAVVDEAGLIDVLRERPDVFAVLDVTTEEPPLPDSPLYTLPNCQLTGHVAGAVGAEQLALGRLVVDDLRRYAAGRAPEHAVSRQDAPLRA